MNKHLVLSLLSFLSFGLFASRAQAVTDPIVNIMDTATGYVATAGQIQEDVASQVSQYTQIKIGDIGDLKAVEKAAKKAERIKNKAEKYQEKADRMKEKMDKAKEKTAGMKAEYDKVKSQADKLKEGYNKAQEKVAKAKEKIDKAKAEYDNIKAEVDKAKNQYEDIKGQVNEAKQGMADLKEGAAALKDVAGAKLDEAQGKLGVEKQAEPEPELGAEPQAAEPQVSTAETLMAINKAVQDNGVETSVEVLDATAPEIVSVSPQDILQKAAEIEEKGTNQVEYTSQYDLEQQLQMMDAAKKAQRAEQAPKNISDEELNSSLKEGDVAKLEVLKASRKGSVRKGFGREVGGQNVQ